MILKKNSINKFVATFVAAVLFTHSTSMKAQVLPLGKTTDIPFLDPKEKPFEYDPIDPDFWFQAMKDIEDENYNKVLEDAFALAEELGPESEDAMEGLLAIGVAFRKLKIYYASTLVLVDVIKKRLGSKLAERALYELNLIGQESFLDPIDISDDLLNSNQFGTLHPDIQSFVSYFVSIHDLVSGFKEWGLQQADKVKSQSFWGQKTIYLKALSEVSQGKLDKAEIRFTKLLTDTTTHPHFVNRAKLQIARISFEKKDFIKAATIYKDLRDFPIREKSRIFLERAWSFYYLKNYSEALGILTALRAPVYAIAGTPERFILEMIIYKQLCYYDKVNEIAKEYYKLYSTALDDIKKRRELKNNEALAHMALINLRVQEEANFINQLRDEIEVIKEMDLNEYAYFKDIEIHYKNKESEVSQRVYFELDKTLPTIAEEVLDSEEQVKFLDFTAKLDALRIVRRGENRDYQSEKMSYVKFDKVFWPVEEEYWMDELDDYRVLIKSQCDIALPSSSEDEGIIKQFGEEFK